MQSEEFLARVQQRAGLTDLEQASQITEAVLAVLGQLRLRGETAYLASQLPEPLGDMLTEPTEQEDFSADEFLARLENQLGGSYNDAEQAARAVLTTVKEGVSEGERMDFLIELPEGFGRFTVDG